MRIGIFTSKGAALVAGAAALATIATACDGPMVQPQEPQEAHPDLGSHEVPHESDHDDPPFQGFDAGPMELVAPQQVVTFEAADNHSWHAGRAMVRQGDRLIIADPDHEAIFELSADTLELIASTPLTGKPERVVAMPDGSLWVTLRSSGELALLDLTRSVTRVSAGLVEPVALAAHPTLPVLYVSGVADGAIVAIDTLSRAVINKVGGLERPRALLVQGDKLHVVLESQGTFSYGLADDGAIKAVVSTSGLRNRNPWQLPDLMNRAGVRAVQAVADPRAGGLLVAHMIASPGDENSMIEQALMKGFGQMDCSPGTPDCQAAEGYGATNIANGFNVPHHPLEGSVTRVGVQSSDATHGPVAVGPEVAETEDEREGESSLTPVLHLMDQPSEIIHHPTLSVAFVAALGSDTVAALNTATTDPAGSPIAVWEVGRAPRGLALSSDGSRLFVYEAHDYSVSEIAIGTLAETWTVEEPADRPILAWHKTTERTSTYAVDPLPGDISRGRRIFTYSRNDALSEQHLFACASCHLDGREDGLVWAIGDGPRQTPALAGRLAGTEPFNWLGSELELEDNMAQTIVRLGGHGLPADKLHDLEAFLLYGLQPIPNPATGLQGRQLNPEEELGKAIFNDPAVACFACHTGDVTTDGRLHNVGTTSPIERELALIKQSLGEGGEEAIRYNTPTLRSLHYTAPYLHDGSAPTLYDVLDMTATTMGHSAHLTSLERDALVAYLLTL